MKDGTERARSSEMQGCAVGVNNVSAKPDAGNKR